MVRMHSRLALLSLGVGALLLGAGAPPQEPKAMDPQNAFEPRSAPGAGQEFLKRFVGEWDVVKSFHPRGGGVARSTGTCTQSMRQDGRFLQSDFTFKQEGGGSTTGQGLIGFDAATGLFTSVWIDSRSTRMSMRRSRAGFDGKQIELFAASLDAESGNPGQGQGQGPPRTKTITRIENDGKTITHRQYVTSPDGAERLMMELQMTRRSADSSKRD